ncbi:MAG TPA: hypothetical protein VF285_01680 [Castellaniella sp.]|uniref:hypothetical protein n=1 Tax=Castellaniella sp. TaxID=1955812 RepID=UPI002F1B9AF9
MTDSGRYPSTPIGQELGRFYMHRSVLRRSIPLFSMTWHDFGRYLKGEAAMIHNTPQRNDHGKGQGGASNPHGHRPAHA